MPLSPVTLGLGSVRLEPLAPAHAKSLSRFCADAETWRYMSIGALSDADAVAAWLASVRAEAEETGASFPFAVVDTATNEAAGSTSFLDYSERHKTVEIGRTWLGADYRRTAFNTACKYLLFQHAFETMRLLRVQLKTDSRNERSQQAIARLGAQREGVLRSHMIMPDGHVRDTVMYSVIANEWPAVKTRLETLLNL